MVNEQACFETVQAPLINLASVRGFEDEKR